MRTALRCLQIHGPQAALESGVHIDLLEFVFCQMIWYTFTPNPLCIPGLQSSLPKPKVKGGCSVPYT